jgi:hypothetical protein
MTQWNEEQNPPRTGVDAHLRGETSQRVDAVRQLIAAGKTNGSDASAGHAEQLARLLLDDEHAVRITAAHGLIGLKAHAVRPVIETLARDAQSAQLRSAVHHVLLALYEQGCLSGAETHVLHALEGPDPAINVARAIPAALRG